MTAIKIKRLAAAVLFTIVIVTTLVGAPVPNAAAQTRALQSAVCVDSITVPTHFRFTQNSMPYWGVVGVAPQPSDDKDIYVYTGPNGSGGILASSTGTDGSDFVVADFNHTPYGTYYPSVTFGNNSIQYTVEWKAGGKILPLNHELNIGIWGPGSDCHAFDVWDVYLEAGATYRFLINHADVSIRLALFRNQGTGAYWAGRDQAVFQVSGVETNGDYVAPASDWYGLVVGPVYRQPISLSALIEVRKLNTCQPLASGSCQSAVPYDPFAGPATSYYFSQPATYWSAIAVAPSPGDGKRLSLRSACDYTAGTPGVLAGSYPGADYTSLIAADFNHASGFPISAYPSIDMGNPYSPYTIEWEDGEDYFYMNSGVSGSVGGTSGTCNLVKMWDILLQGGVPYRISFSESGTADIRLAIFGHTDTAPYYAGLQQAIYSLNDPALVGYVPGWTDYYGLAVFANKRETAGSYYVSFEKYNDCDAIASNSCLESQGNLKDFFMGASENNYWLAVGVLPADGDDKDISVYSACDGAEPLFGFSNGTQGMDFVVADCNHSPAAASSGGPESPEEPAANSWYPRVTYGSPGAAYTVSCDLGNTISEDLFPNDVVVPGTVGSTSGTCGMLKIWDVYLQAGVTYTFGFTRGGDADVRVALFRNSTNNRVWLGRAGRQWELTESMNFDYTAPATDYYGLVVFANRRGKTGSYTLRVSRASGVTGIDPEPLAPSQFALYQNAPNPFNPSTEIRYDVPSSGGHVQLRVYDVHGRLVRTLVDTREEGGAKSLIWDARDDSGALVATGVYFYRLDAPGFSETRKMVVMK
jgi:hypothetical protein